MERAMTDGGRAGPLLIGLPGTELDPTSRDWLRHPAVGGVVLFSRNYTDRAQLARLLTGIHHACRPRPLVCIDQEGGRVQRLRSGFTRLPPLGALGRIHRDDPVKAADMAYRHGRVMAGEMLAVGIDLSFAPVLDLDRGSSVIGDRAFSDSPDTVRSLGDCYLSGMHDAGMKTTGKHFPGHGSTVSDSHVADVTDGRTLEAIGSTDLLPFRELSARLDSVMIAHVKYPEIDDRPAGYSRIWLQDILRRRLSFAGVILSDDLGMHAARSIGDLRTRTLRCLEAGCELVLVCQPGDVATLLASLDADPRCELPNAGDTIARLYSHPTVPAAELEFAAREGVGEWAQWQRSLETLAVQEPA